MTDAKLKDGVATYHASFALDASGQWLVECDEIPQVHTFGRTLGKAREYFIDALALWLNVSIQSVQGAVKFNNPTLPDEIRHSAELAIAARELAEAENKVAQDLMQKASAGLVRDGHLSMRDAAVVLGISHQRVQQLVATYDPCTTTIQESLGTPAEGAVTAFREYLTGGEREDVDAFARLTTTALMIARTRTN